VRDGYKRCAGWVKKKSWMGKQKCWMGKRKCWMGKKEVLDG
jgi:hypothetical protein